MRTAIIGTGMYVPPRRVTNDDLTRIMDTSDDWIRARTGIEERRFVEPGEATSDVALPAARAALEDAGLTVENIDYLIVATMTPDHYFPGTAPFLARKLGMTRVPALDIRQQCAGFVYGLQLADALIRSEQHRNVLLVGAEVHSSLMPWESWDVLLGDSDRPVPDREYARNTETRGRTVLFGDGAGAVVLTAREEGGIIDVLLHTDGNFAEKLWTKAGGSAYRPYFTQEMIESGDITPLVEGREVFRLAVTLMPEVLRSIVERNGLAIEDLDLLLFHQANLRINEAVQKRLGVPDDKVINNIQRYGNTTAGTLPILLHEARQQGRVKPGSLLAFVALGAGLNWGAVLYRA